MLSGLSVLDLSRVLSGPFATQQLADLGAEVIKVEEPKGGDDTRRFGPPFIGGESTYFMSINRAKKSVAIDLKQREGVELVLRLAERADVAIENFKPGTADRLGIGAEALMARNPRLVCCSISGYGAEGHEDYRGRPGYDAVIQAVSGLMSLTGAVNGPPSRVGVAIADMVAGLYAAQGILAALVERAASGRGRRIEVSMQDAMASLLTYQAGIYFASGRPPPRMGDAHPSICPYESLPAKDGLYMLAVGNDQQFARFAELIGEPELAADPRFRTNAKRVEHRAALLERIVPKLRERTIDEWDRGLAAAQIPGGPVLDVAAALEHPQIAARATISRHAHPTAGEIRTVATPVRADGAPPLALPAPPLLGQHTREVLGALGLAEGELDALEARGVIASRRPADR